MRPGVPSAAYGFGTGVLRYMIYNDPDWTYVGYDFANYEQDSAAIGAILNSNDPDLDAFRANGGKLLLYHGWSDAALSALATIDYVDAVYERDAKARDDVRLFMLPGVLHCAGGPGPDMVPYLDALETWDKSNAAPDSLVASYRDGSGGRTVCAWPQTQTYSGDDPKDPASFTCK